MQNLQRAKSGHEEESLKVTFFSTKAYDRRTFDAANLEFGHDLNFFEERLRPETVSLANGAQAICVFVNDDLSSSVLESLHERGVRLVALRCAGFNNVDLARADALGMTVARVPAYSPYAVAEHAVGLILTLNRRFHRAFNRVREGNFALDGLLGFDLRARCVGVVGTGKIGRAFCQILSGFGCRILAHDPYPDPELSELGVEYVERDALLAEADVVALHLPLTPESYHMIDGTAIERMKPGVMLINTSRGALIDTPAVIAGLKSGKIGALGLDVYEEEADLFFEDLSDTVIHDDVFARLLTFPNVVITGHQGFFTREALHEIAITTLSNVSAFEKGEGTLHRVSLEDVRGG